MRIPFEDVNLPCFSYHALTNLSLSQILDCLAAYDKTPQ